jgi:alpha-L-rhamnosidase
MIKIISFLYLLLLAQLSFGQFSLQKLQTNYQEKPLGTDLPTPQFSWQMISSQRGEEQKAYQIVVKDEKNAVVWDSKKVQSGLAHAIQYLGTALSPTTRYSWTLIVWDQANRKVQANSWFETGLLDPSIKAWSGAEWIGGGAQDIPFYSHYLSVFKLEYTMQLAESSTKAAFVFGANESRLANKYLNYMGVQKGKNESYVAVEIDVSKLSEDTASRAHLNIYRVGYTAADSEEKPFKSFSIPSKLFNFSNKNAAHRVFIDCNFDLFEFYIDGYGPANQIKEKTTGEQPRFGARGLNLNPVGTGNNYISFPMLADIGFKTAVGQKAYFSDIIVKNYRTPSNIIFKEDLEADQSIFKGLKLNKQTYEVPENTLVTANPSKNAVPMLRHTFKADNKIIEKARLYVTARGIYEMHINGQRLSKDYFNPGLTQYNKNHMYQTYDITANLKSGQSNAIGAWLSEGWWSGNITFSGENWNWFGDRQSLLAKMVISYTDGTEQIIVSKPESWKIYTDGPIRVGSFFQGEVYDANKEFAIKDWSKASYDDHGWKSAEVVPLEGTGVKGTITDALGRKNTLSYDDFKIIGQMGENATIVKTLVPISVKEVRPKVFVYDMGQNMVGFPQILIKNGKKGQTINLRYAEVLYPNLSDSKGNEGMVMMENIRAALTQDQYVLKGGDEIMQPRFTFHGYRYLEITGIDQALPITAIKGLVISSIKDLSSFYETNNTLVNKLWQNIGWSLRSNFLSIPTDTPARNERMGWSGDISVFSKSATYMADANLFLRRHLLAMRDIQAESGRFTDVAPVGGGFGGTLWGSAGITVAWETYRQYGDEQLLSEHFTAMKRYVDFLETKFDKNFGVLNEGPLGDWLSPEGNKNDNTLFWMAYYAYDLDLVSKIAKILGINDLSEKFASRSTLVKQKFNEVYIDPQTHRTVKSGLKTGFMGPPSATEGNQKTEKGQLIDTQASYAIPLALGTFNAENKPFAIKYLREAVARKNKDDNGVLLNENGLMTGFIGTASISEALSENESNDLAYKLLVNVQYPSWLYSVVNGATSIWERLNSYTVENGFGGNNSMNSFNHYSFGSVAAWMCNYSLGIQRDAETPAFKSFILKPMPDPTKSITFAKGYYDSMYGRIKSEWKNQDGKMSYKFTVPANSSATLYLSADSSQKITENGKSIQAWPGLKQENGKVIIPLKSGDYVFVVN